MVDEQNTKKEEVIQSETPKVNNDRGSEGSNEYEKLKEQNDKFEKELLRAREMRAEAQRLEAEKLMSGTAGGHIEPKAKEETPAEYAKRISEGKI